MFGPSLAARMPGDGPSGFAGFTAFFRDWVNPVFADLHDREPGENPYPVFPAPGGLLPWGSTQDGDHLFWLTETKDPDAWRVAVWLRHAPPTTAWCRIDTSMTGFLLSLVDQGPGGSPLRRALLPPTDRPRRWTRTQDWETRYT